MLMSLDVNDAIIVFFLMFFLCQTFAGNILDIPPAVLPIRLKDIPRTSIALLLARASPWLVSKCNSHATNDIIANLLYLQ